jgi:hypothetical protein
MVQTDQEAYAKLIAMHWKVQKARNRILIAYTTISAPGRILRSTEKVEKSYFWASERFLDDDKCLEVSMCTTRKRRLHAFILSKNI